MFNLFRKDPEKQKQKKFEQFERDYAGYPAYISNAKAVWLTSRGNYHGNKKEYQLAIKDFNEAISIKFDHLPAYMGLTAAYKEMGESQKALSFLAKMPNEAKLGNKIIATKRQAVESVIGYKITDEEYKKQQEEWDQIP